MFDFRSRKEKEDAILWVLAHTKGPTYGLDLCRITGIARGTIYIYMGRLEEQGRVHGYTEAATNEFWQCGRRVYFAVEHPAARPVMTCPRGRPKDEWTPYCPNCVKCYSVAFVPNSPTG